MMLPPKALKPLSIIWKLFLRDNMENQLNKKHYSLKRITNAASQFLIGRIFTGIAGFLVTIMIARNLSIPSYTIYTILLGLSIFVGQVSSFSLDAIAHRFIPEAIVKGEKKLQVQLTFLILVMRFITTFSTAWLLSLLAPKIALFFSIPKYSEEIKIWIFLLCFQPLFIFSNQILQAFLLQRTLKSILVFVSMGRLTIIVFLIYTTNLFTLNHLIYAETSIYFIGIVISVFSLIMALPKTDQNEIKTKSSFSYLAKRMVRFGLFSYLRNLMTICSGRAVSRLLIGKHLIPFQIATFGFAVNLTEIVNRYLPSSLLRNMIRPVLMGRFSEKKDLVALSKETNLIFKFHYLLLVPLIIWIALKGNQITSIMSKGKYPEAGWIFAALLGLKLVQGYNNQILQPQANALEKTFLLFIVDFIPVLCLMPAFFYLQYIGIAGFILLKYIGTLGRDITLIYFFKKAGITHWFDWNGAFKVLLSFLLTILLLISIVSDKPTILSIIFTGLGSFVLFWVFTMSFKIFNPDERSILARTFPSFTALFRPV